MPEWLKSLLAAVGGGAVVLTGILTIFKTLFVKLFDTGIETAFGKSLEKYRNQLSRSARAYEILLDREMQFYEHMESISAELVPLAHDFIYCIDYPEKFEPEGVYESFRKSVLRYGDVLKAIKSEALSHKAYIPEDVFSAATQIVKQMQLDIPFLADTAKLIYAKSYQQIDRTKVQENYDKLIDLLANLSTITKKRLEELSGI